MTTVDLQRLTIRRKTGSEKFHTGGQSAETTLLDFWQWSGSDLVDNTYRGVLAEFIVGKALGLVDNRVRESWATWDLETDDGIRIEVKSASFLQSWGQRELSRVQFVVPKRRGFDPVANTLEPEPSRHADIYVLALLAHRDKATLDPLDLAQWQFYVVPTRMLDERTRSQHSISLSALEQLVGPAISYADLAAQVRTRHGEHPRVPAN